MCLVLCLTVQWATGHGEAYNLGIRMLRAGIGKAGSSAYLVVLEVLCVYHGHR